MAETDRPEQEDASGPDPPFEDVVAAFLQVDPAGIAGKHRKEEPEREEGPGL